MNQKDIDTLPALYLRTGSICDFNTLLINRSTLRNFISHCEQTNIKGNDKMNPSFKIAPELFFNTYEIKNSTGGSPYFFKTKEEWDAYYLSNAGHEKVCKERTSAGPYERAYNEPTEFPCIAYQGPLVRNANGPDQYVFFFIYEVEYIGHGEQDEALKIMAELGVNEQCANDVGYLRTLNHHTPELERELIELHKAGNPPNMTEFGFTKDTQLALT